MNLKLRIKELEKRSLFKTVPLNAVDICKWYAMYVSRNFGTGFPTRGNDPPQTEETIEGFTVNEWKWFEENEQKAIETMRILNNGKEYIVSTLETDQE
ncbi:MAG: hypothetical protein WBD36_01755 [Bacteroidota bacterium]